jgi:hypothetical protein
MNRDETKSSLRILGYVAILMSVFLITILLTGCGSAKKQGGSVKVSSPTATAASQSTTAAATTAETPNIIQLRGTLTLSGSVMFGPTVPGIYGSVSCYGTGGYSDIREGAAVVVTDNDSKTIAITQLGQGLLTTASVYGCVFPFLTNVPGGRGFYGLTVTHRGTVKFTEGQINGPIQVSLGG